MSVVQDIVVALERGPMRRTILLFLTAALVMAVAPHASAGGSWLHVDRRASEGAGGGDGRTEWAGVGALVTLRAGLSSGSLGPVHQGTYAAYLWQLGMRRPGTFLAEVFVRTGRRHPFVAETTFRIPAVPTGRYRIEVCARECGRGVGDLIGGSLWIGRSPAEARLHAAVTDLRREIRDQRRRADGQTQLVELLESRLVALRTQLVSLETELDALEAQRAWTASQRDVALQKAREAQGQISSARDEAASWRATTYWILLLVAVGVCIALMRRRRYVRVRIPDSPRGLAEPVATRRGRS
jgi:hypothetical protein